MSNAWLLLPATKLGQGYIFTGICDSVHRGSTWAGTTPGTRYTPWNQVHPPGPGTPPRTRYTPRPGTPLGLGTPPWDQVHSPGTRYTPQTRYPPDQVPPGPGTHPGTRYTPWDQVHPPGPVHTVRYGQQAGGTNHTGMHSC